MIHFKILSIFQFEIALNIFIVTIFFHFIHKWCYNPDNKSIFIIFASYSSISMQKKRGKCFDYEEQKKVTEINEIIDPANASGIKQNHIIFSMSLIAFFLDCGCVLGMEWMEWLFGLDCCTFLENFWLIRFVV